jgi:hypothetical protein
MKRWGSIVLWCVSAFLMAGLVGEGPAAKYEHAAIFGRDAVAARGGWLFWGG